MNDFQDHNIEYNIENNIENNIDNYLENNIENNNIFNYNIDQNKNYKTNIQQPWVEKYRPISLEDIAQQTEIIKTLTNGILNYDFPHMIFYGPSGTGKTSTIISLAKFIFGPELYKTRVLELNASDERGIKVIREKVKIFAQKAINHSNNNNIYNKIPPFKIIILDEADTMTPDAQSALRRTIEDNSKLTRFCLICNHLTKIIEPISSRCAKMRFQQISKNNMSNHLKKILIKEKLFINEPIIQYVIDNSNGDMRKAITFLQYMYTNLYDNKGKLNIKNITNLNTKIDIDEAKEKIISDYLDLKEYIFKLISNGIQLKHFMKNINELWIIPSNNISEFNKAFINEIISNIEYNLNEGSNETIQYFYFLTKLKNILYSL